MLLRSVDSSWNVRAHGDAREGKRRGNWRMEWVASTLHTTSEHGVSNITTADAHTSAASSRLNWSPRRFKWNRTFRRKTKLVSERVPSHFKRSLLHYTFHGHHLFKHVTLHNNVLSWPLKMGTTGCPETSVSNYHYTLHDSLEE